LKITQIKAILSILFIRLYIGRCVTDQFGSILRENKSQSIIKSLFDLVWFTIYTFFFKL